MSVEMWYERALRLRKNYNFFIRFLLWIGFVKIGRKSNQCSLDAMGQLLYMYPETIIWPFHWPPMHVFRYLLKYGPRVYVFRNLPGVIKWLPGRLLPMRWGFGICGIEFGDRG